MNTSFQIVLILWTLISTSILTAREITNIKITDQQVRQLLLDKGFDIRTRWENLFHDIDLFNVVDQQHIEEDFNRLIAELVLLSTQALQGKHEASLEELIQAIGIKDINNCTVSKRRQSMNNCSYCKTKSLCGMKAPKALYFYTIQENSNLNYDLQDFFKVICLLTQYNLEAAFYKNMSHHWQHTISQLPGLGILISTCQDQPLFVSANLQETDSVIEPEIDEQTGDYLEEPSCFTGISTLFSALFCS